jgi:chemotaxis protein MotB
MSPKKASKFVVAALVIGLVSCVPQRKLEEEQAKRQKFEKELTELKAHSQECDTESKEIKSKISLLEKELHALRQDTTLMGNSFRTLNSKYEKLNQVNDQLMDKQARLVEGAANDTKRIASELHGTQEALFKKEDELKATARELEARRVELDRLTVELKKREERVNELEAILKRKDAAVADLKRKVQEALLGFENKGLSITQKNGKVYVSLDESLLFASGSTVVEEKGIEALKKLAKVLEQNTDINVMVEGHTDDVPMKGKGDIKDNWDLSVMRATAIVKIITSNSKVDPHRLIAAGRSEYVPLDNGKTPEARKKNRRTEIILTPKLDELLKVLETN